MWPEVRQSVVSGIGGWTGSFSTENIRPETYSELMRIVRTHPRTARAGLVAAAFVASLLVGCSSDDGAGEIGNTETTVTDTITQQQTTSPAQGKGPGDDPCTDNPVTNPLTGDQPIPVRFANSDDADVRFDYTVMEGKPDPCTPLSWVKLAGTNGTGGPGATAGSNREIVVLFGDGQLITDPAPILAGRIKSVEQVSDRAVRVNYMFYTDTPAAAGEMEPGSATFNWDGEQLKVTENTLPISQNETAEKLDLSGVS